MTTRAQRKRLKAANAARYSARMELKLRDEARRREDKIIIEAENAKRLADEIATGHSAMDLEKINENP